MFKGEPEYWVRIWGKCLHWCVVHANSRITRKENVVAQIFQDEVNGESVTETLATVIPVAATELTPNEQNEVAEAIKNNGGKKKQKASYSKYDDKQRSEIAKFAIQSGNKSASRRFGVPESTVRGMKMSYNEAKAAALTNDAIKSLPTKKRGPKTLLPEELDQKVMDMSSSMRLAGAVVNYNVLIAIAKGIVTANDRTLLP